MFGSTVIAIRTDREIVIGSDSKVVGTDGSDRGTVCKIIQIGNIFFSHTGVAGSTSIGFDVQATVRQALESAEHLGEAIQNFLHSVHHPLHQILVATRRDAPEFYKHNIEGQSALSAVFCGVIDNIPRLSYLELKPVHHAEADDGLAIQVDQGIDVRSDNEGPAFVVIGHKNAVTTQLGEQPDIWMRTGIVSAVRRLIELQIESTPQVVGPPIAVLRMDRQSAKWVNKPSACPGIKKIRAH